MGAPTWCDYFSRKFLLALAVIAGAFALAWFGKDVYGFASAAATALGFYSGANVMIEYFKSKNGQAPASKE